MVYGGMGGGPRGKHNIVIQVDDWTSREGYIFTKRTNSFSQNYFFLLRVVNPVHNQQIRSMVEWVEVLWPNIVDRVDDLLNQPCEVVEKYLEGRNQFFNNKNSNSFSQNYLCLLWL